MTIFECITYLSSRTSAREYFLRSLVLCKSALCISFVDFPPKMNLLENSFHYCYYGSRWLWRSTCWPTRQWPECILREFFLPRFLDSPRNTWIDIRHLLANIDRLTSSPRITESKFQCVVWDSRPKNHCCRVPSETLRAWFFRLSCALTRPSSSSYVSHRIEAQQTYFSFDIQNR